MDTEQVTIEKLVHGGQGLATLADGRRAFVWNALPGEIVEVRIIKKKRHYIEAIAETIIQASPDRLAPRDQNYLATSPWQILPFEKENQYKKEIVAELFSHEKIALPMLGEVVATQPEWQYRNKMEYSFWGDEDGLHLALHQRGSSGKQIVEGSALALPALDAAANAVLALLQPLNIRAGDLKTLIVRTSQAGKSVAALFVKRRDFYQLELPAQGVTGLRVYYSNPKSPASVTTELLQELGSAELTDTLLGKQFTYDVDSFFQVNTPIFEKTIADIRSALQPSNCVIDMYAGVGSIGLSVAPETVTLVELDPATAAMARLNADASGAEVIEASTEKALQYITSEHPVIFDPPRSGLHSKVIECVRETLPEQIIYLSCNPATQARDLDLLQDVYEIADFKIYNFFPKTPHIETLAILKRRNDL